jgi:hypothetical protein
MIYSEADAKQAFMDGYITATKGFSLSPQIDHVREMAERAYDAFIKEQRRIKWAYGCGPGTLAGNEDI